MDWNRTIHGELQCLQILRDNDRGALDVAHNPEAGANILALAQLVAFKAFARVGASAEQWAAHGEDAIQDAACTLLEQAKYHYQPRLAYHFARKVSVRRAQRLVTRKLPATHKERRAGHHTYAPASVSLEGVVRDARQSGYPVVLSAPSPEQVLLGAAEAAERDQCIDCFAEVVHHLVLTHIQPSHRYESALKDATIFHLTLQGNGYLGIARHFGCGAEEAWRKVKRARTRLGAFLVAQGVEVVAGWYSGVASGARVLPPVRGQADFVAAFTRRREATYRETHTTSPSAVQRKRWKRDAYLAWAQMDHREWQGDVHGECVAVAAE
jgi:hypothetical protein